jgi:phosphate transport system substrate-binding protein
MNIKKLFNNEAGVSPIVATLVLVVVAIAGAAAVGTILGSFSGDVSNEASADSAYGAASTEILVAGSTTVQPVSEFIAKAYMAQNPGVKVTVQAGGSDAGIASAGLGIVDIGAASKYMSDSAKSKYPDLEEHVIGGSAVVVIVNDKYMETAGYNGSDVITKDELKYLYNVSSPDTTVTALGDQTKLSPTNKFVIFHRQEGSGTEETFSKYVGEGGADVDRATTGTNIAVDTAIGNQGVLDAVKGSSSPAIGFVDYGFAKNVDGVTILKITEGSTTYTADSTTVKAAVKDVLAGETSSTHYVAGLCRPLVYLTSGSTPSVVKDYIQFAQSPASLESFEKAGYYGITELEL